MEKTRINFDILLPEVPSERDECVQRIIKALAYKRGIDKVHVVPEEGNKKAQLCFHYDPEIISINTVEQIAKKAGTEITEHYGHLLIEISGVRHPRHARLIEAQETIREKIKRNGNLSREGNCKNCLMKNSRFKF